MKKQQMGGFGFYMIILIIMAFVWYFVSTLGTNKSDYNYSDFLKDLEDERVEKVVVSQNEQVPTGYLEITLEGKSTKTIVYVTDVNAAVETMVAADFDNYVGA